MIVANYSNGGTPRFRVLGDEQCREIYLAGLECLERIGILVGNVEARALLAGAGARVEANRVYIPPHVIRSTLSTTPPAWTVYGAAGSPAMRVAPDRVNFGPGLTNTYFVDPETCKRRVSRRGDPGLTARLCDALPNIDYVIGLALISDVQADLASVYEFAELLCNTGKPIVAWAHKQSNVEAIWRMAAAAVGGEDVLRARPRFALFSTYASPLRATDEDLGNMLWAAEHSVPVIYLGGPTLGIDSPFTAASGLVVHLASALAGLAVVQLKRPGAAVAIGGVPSPMDLRTARPSYGAPEMSLNSAAAVDVARYLGIPFMGTAGATESKLIDAQAGAESAIQVLMSALSGPALVHDAGFLDCADIGSLGMLVLTDEIIGMAKRILRGVEVSRETIMLDLIEHVGPGGHFLDNPTNAALARREVWMPTVFDRNQHELWEAAGAKDTSHRVHEKVQRILAKHVPPALPPGASAAIAAVVAESETQPTS
jgi:trimethylamine---corrinoid protein Co-methyltransferase